MTYRKTSRAVALSAGLAMIGGQSVMAATVVLEAESATSFTPGSTGDTWDTVADPDAFGEFAIVGAGSPNNQAESPLANYEDIPFEVAGTYNLFVRYRTDLNQTGQLRVPGAFGGSINNFIINGAISASSEYVIVKLL